MIEDKRERILDAAFDKFKQYGFVKTTVDEIARQAQVGKGTIYFYFKSKEAILLALVDREMAKGYAEIATAVAKERETVDKLKRVIQVSFDFFHKNALTSKVMAMDQGLVLALITDKNKEIQQLSIAVIKALVEQGQQEGVFQEMDSQQVAYIIDSLIRSFHYLHYLGLDIYKPDAILDSLFGLLFSGLGKG
ncbi:MAG: TetR/AcrR family transcriptional regulator [Myxococcota bacterium]|nr:TetR/AcrR family transcriptional regulator [Myxococcota bacterium]